MESINSIFLKNSYEPYTNNQQKTVKYKHKDILANTNNDIMSKYLDILYSDNTEDNSATNLTDLLQTYLPIKRQNLHFGNIFL